MVSSAHQKQGNPHEEKYCLQTGIIYTKLYRSLGDTSKNLTPVRARANFYLQFVKCNLIQVYNFPWLS